MASLQLRPPDSFDFKSPDGWLKWRRRFEQYRAASGLAGESDPRQVSTLLYCLGEDAIDVLASTNIAEADRSSYAPVVEKFNEYFQIKRNVIFERARFNQRDQLRAETSEKYIASLYGLVEHCDYGALKDQMIRDRLVVGIQDKKLSQQLQLDANLTLEKAKKTIRQKEAVKEQGQELGNTPKLEDPLDEMRFSSGHRGWLPRPHSHRQGGARARQCSRCGQTPHQTGERCPAADAVCHGCGKKGHYKAQCFSKNKATKLASVDLEASFLDAVSDSKKTVWTATVRVGKKNVEFKLDTGAGVTAVTEETYQALGNRQLGKATRMLFGPAKQELEVLGQFTDRLAHKQVSSVEEVYVVRGLKSNLLGLPAITALHLVERLCSTETAAGEDIMGRFPKVFTGLGTLGEEYTIQLREDAKPFALYAPRSVPIPLRPKVEEELARMERMGVIRQVSQPTPWCAGMVVVPKRSGDIRICVDLKPLNESVLREVHPIPKVDDILAQLAGAKIFSKLDANSGFWQIPLSDQSKLLTTFVTPFGRYCFNKLPFGISSAPELYQKRMNHMLEGLPGVLCLIDDTLIHGKDRAEHDARLTAVMRRLEKAGVTLNTSKCAFRQRAVKFLGHLIDEHGIRADPDKTAAVRNMDTPKSITELRRFMGMVNQLGKFSRQIADLGQPLRSLLSVKNAWVWGPDQEHAFTGIKNELAQPTVLALYDPAAKTKVSADASAFGLGAVLLQQHGDDWKPVAFASRAMNETEQRYAQIEKEALAATWACEKFSDYLLGLHFTIESDHKPLVPLLNTKSLNSLPPRILRFRLRLARFDYAVGHVPGKLLYTADTLSRAPTADAQADDTEAFIRIVTIPALPASPDRLDAYRRAQREDPGCTQITKYCNTNWPRRERTDPTLLPFWKVRGSLTVCDDLLLFNSRIVVPKSMQKETMNKIHVGHQGIQRCLERAKASVWWPGITALLTQKIENCLTCREKSCARKEPLIISSLPDYPWQRICLSWTGSTTF